MGQPYLIASQIPGIPADDASATFGVEEEGYYRIFVRTKNWKLPEAPGQFKVVVDGTELSNLCGKMPTPTWYWEIAGDIYLEKGSHVLNLCDKTGWLSRCATIIITNDFNFTPSPESPDTLTMSGCLCKSTADWYMRGFYMEKQNQENERPQKKSIQQNDGWKIPVTMTICRRRNLPETRLCA